MVCQSTSLLLVAMVAVTMVPLNMAQYPRNVVETLTVSNGQDDGDWHMQEFCAAGTYAGAFNLKVQPDGGGSIDDTAGNGVYLVCQNTNYNDQTWRGLAQSQVGPWGNWTGEMPCPKGSLGERMLFINFREAVYFHSGLNNIQMTCADMKGIDNDTAVLTAPDPGAWGSWGSWSADCPAGSAICGIQSRVQEPQCTSGDDLSMTDVKFFCCDD